MKQMHMVIMGILIVLMSTISLFLYHEYNFFHQQSQIMLQMQEQYRSYVEEIKHIVDDYTLTKERVLLLEELLSDEKKKQYECRLMTTHHIPFPAGMRIFSTDEQPSTLQDAFLVVNRELEYLKESTIAHIKEAEINSLLRRIDFDEWRDYTQQQLMPKRVIQQKNRKDRKATTRCITNRASKRSIHHDMNFSWPIDRSKFWLSSFFGPRKRKNGSYKFHNGIDMAALKGTVVMASAPGKIIEARHSSGYGNTIVIAHNGKYKTRYAHLDSILVHVGQYVFNGAPIGTVGDTGFVRSAFGRDASHLHFELYVFGKAVNPMHFLV